MEKTKNKNVWVTQKGLHKLQGFLTSCVGDPTSNDPISVPPDENYLLTYSVRYGLVEPSIFTVTLLGRRILESDIDDDCTKIIRDLLKSYDFGNASWINSPRSPIKEFDGVHCYNFEAVSKNESNFAYARFLSVLGILVEEDRWQSERGIYYCPLTLLGKAIVYTPPTSEEIIPYGQEDNAVTNIYIEKLDARVTLNGSKNIVAGAFGSRAQNESGGDAGDRC